MALSSVPLWTTDEDDRQVPVDLTLQESGGALAPAAPVVPVRIAKRASDGVALGGFRFTPKQVSAGATAAAFADKAFFANAQVDTDFMVAALPSGAEASWVLRSSDSPEQLGLELSLPRDASLVVDPELATGAAIKRDGEIVARIAPPVAIDADGEAVPATYEVVGSELRVKVAHRDRDAKYPILVGGLSALLPRMVSRLRPAGACAHAGRSEDGRPRDLRHSAVAGGARPTTIASRASEPRNDRIRRGGRKRIAHFGRSLVRDGVRNGAER